MGDTAAFTVTKENVEDDRALLQVNFFLGESCLPNFSFNVKDFNYKICCSKSLTMIKKERALTIPIFIKLHFVVVAARSNWDRDSGREATHPGSLHTSTPC